MAFQKDHYNYYMIYESVHIDARGNSQIYRLVPIRPDKFVIKRLLNTQDTGPIPGEFRVRKTIRNAPNYRDGYFNPIKTGWEFTIKILNTNFEVPIIKCSQWQQGFCLGNRYEITDPVYFVTWCADDSEIERIRNGFQYTNIISYDLSGRITSPLTIIPLPSTSTFPTHVLNGWIENACRTELCPITMDALTMENVCSTPCYHLISYDAAVAWINEKHNCPVCRGNCEINMLHKC
jgi:hypothetical protein